MSIANMKHELVGCFEELKKETLGKEYCAESRLDFLEQYATLTYKALVSLLEELEKLEAQIETSKSSEIGPVLQIRLKLQKLQADSFKEIAEAIESSL